MELMQTTESVVPSANASAIETPEGAEEAVDGEVSESEAAAAASGLPQGSDDKKSQ